MQTKIEVINDAYSRLRISGLTVQPSPALTSKALSRQEQMMAEFELTRNMCMGYNFEVSPDPNSLTNVILPYHNMTALNLAMRLVPDLNKQVPPELSTEANAALTSVSSALASRNVREIQYPRRMPVGSGNSFRYNRFQRWQHPQPLPPNNCATNTIIVNDVNDYEESFKAYLDDNETIASYQITSDNSLIIVSSANNDPLITYRIQANSPSTLGTWQQVQIVITTSAGRVQTRLINFNIEHPNAVGQFS